MLSFWMQLPELPVAAAVQATRWGDRDLGDRGLLRDEGFTSAVGVTLPPAKINCTKASVGAVSGKPLGCVIVYHFAAQGAPELERCMFERQVVLANVRGPQQLEGARHASARTVLRGGEPCLSVFLPSSEADDWSHAPIAESLGIKAGTFRVRGLRLRARYSALLEREMAQTVAGRGQVDEERRSLLEALGVLSF